MSDPYDHYAKLAHAHGNVKPRRWNGTEWVYDAVHHIDGDPRNNDLANLRIVEVAVNRGEAPLPCRKPTWE